MKGLCVCVCVCACVCVCVCVCVWVCDNCEWVLHVYACTVEPLIKDTPDIIYIR